jgi:hypothetical protein
MVMDGLEISVNTGELEEVFAPGFYAGTTNINSVFDCINQYLI